ncbi:hypothetical protein HYQ46_007205 [Verticillium longisporum]|nr:hypothetical protein HYQ46_007205 [Verticillium longisporum]
MHSLVNLEAIVGREESDGVVEGRILEDLGGDLIHLGGCPATDEPLLGLFDHRCLVFCLLPMRFFNVGGDAEICQRPIFFHLKAGRPVQLR